MLSITAFFVRPGKAPFLAFLCLMMAIGTMGFAVDAMAQAGQPGKVLNGLPAGFGVEGDLIANFPADTTFNPSSDWTKRAGDAGAGVGLLAPTDGSVIFPYPDASVVQVFHVEDGAKFINDIPEERFTGGSKFSANPNTGWALDGNDPPAKNDMQHILGAFTQDGAGDLWISVAGDRRATNGTSYIDFRFHQNQIVSNVNGTFTSFGPDNGLTEGDFVITMLFSQGGDNPQFFFNRWENPGDGFTFVEIPFDTTLVRVAGNINGTAFVPWSAFNDTLYEQHAFVEASVNISALYAGLGGYNPCDPFTASTLAFTVTPILATPRLPAPIATDMPGLIRAATSGRSI